jgi:hypothetical protein
MKIGGSSALEDQVLKNPLGWVSYGPHLWYPWWLWDGSPGPVLTLFNSLFLFFCDKPIKDDAHQEKKERNF